MENGTGCKIDALVERHGLEPPEPGFDSFDDYLLARWTGRSGRPSEGYQSLTDYINRRLQKQVYEANGRDTLATQLESEYEVLTGDDDLLRRELMDDLSADGIDAERLTGEFVSRSTTRRHLKDCLDGEKAVTEAETDWERQSIEIALNQAEDKTRKALRSLSSKDEFLDLEDVAIEIDVNIACSECPTRIPLKEALDRGYVCPTHHETPSEAGSDLAVLLLLPALGWIWAHAVPLLVGGVL